MSINLDRQRRNTELYQRNMKALDDSRRSANQNQHRIDKGRSEWKRFASDQTAAHRKKQASQGCSPQIATSYPIEPGEIELRKEGRATSNIIAFIFGIGGLGCFTVGSCSYGIYLMGLLKGRVMGNTKDLGRLNMLFASTCWFFAGSIASLAKASDKSPQNK